MFKWYFTCGQIHRHICPNGKIWDKDSVVCVESKTDDMDAAVDFIYNKFGRQWGSVYSDFSKIEKFFKTGIVQTFKL